MNALEVFVVPRDYNELVKNYGGFVARVLRRYDAIGRHTMDLNQDCWCALLASDVLAKFWASLAKPSQTMTGAQAAAYLDVKFRTFFMPYYVIFLSRKQGTWFPQPVKGRYTSQDTLWNTADIVKLRELGRYKVSSRLNPDEPLPELPVSSSVPTKSRFEAYLTVAIHNHFANFCRSKERKDKDIYLAPCTDGTAWESSVADGGGDSPEECAEVRIAMEKLGESGQEVLSLLDQGYTLTEACSRSAVSIAKIRMLVGR
jgi:hypothetical protein